MHTCCLLFCGQVTLFCSLHLNAAGSSSKRLLQTYLFYPQVTRLAWEQLLVPWLTDCWVFPNPPLRWQVGTWSSHFTRWITHMYLCNGQLECSRHHRMDPDQDLLSSYFYLLQQWQSIGGPSEMHRHNTSSFCGHLFFSLWGIFCRTYTEMVMLSQYCSHWQSHIRWNHTVIFIFVFCCCSNYRVNITGR